MAASEVTFVFESSLLARAALHGIVDRFCTRRDAPWTLRRDYYDTFDWRLYRDGGALCAERSNRERLLCWREQDGTTRHRARVGHVPDFARELEAGPFREELIRVTGVRRLLPVVAVEVSGDSIAVLDRREKTVVRVHCERGSASTADSRKRWPIAERLRVVPVLGYDADLHAVVRHLEEVPETRVHGGSDLDLALAAIGMRAGAYTSKLDLLLDPEMRTDEAVRRILTRLLQTIRANEDGTSRNVDPEFLHDFRVAVRRTRSCLGQLKGIFDRETTCHFSREFAWLARATGRTRDLDVWLLSIGDYRRHVPETLQSGLQGLESWLGKQQRVEQKTLAQALSGERYRELIRDWNRFLGRPASAQTNALTPRAERNVREVAAERIGKACARVRKQGSSLNDGTPAKTVHRLRIDCKKLRYLLEFFRSVFDEALVMPLVASLKRLQDQLGEFNDLDVQVADLRRVASAMVDDGAAKSDTLLAMGCLLGRLAGRQRRVRRKAIDSFQSFAEEIHPGRLAELLR